MSGTATDNADYNLSSTNGQVTIPVGSNSAVVTLTAVADHVQEGKEKATMTLQPGSNYKIPAGKKKKKIPKASVTILDAP